MNAITLMGCPTISFTASWMFISPQAEEGMISGKGFKEILRCMVPVGWRVIKNNAKVDRKTSNMKLQGIRYTGKNKKITLVQLNGGLSISTLFKRTEGENNYCCCNKL